MAKAPQEPASFKKSHEARQRNRAKILRRTEMAAHGLFSKLNNYASGVSRSFWVVGRPLSAAEVLGRVATKLPNTRKRLSSYSAEIFSDKGPWSFSACQNWRMDLRQKVSFS